MDHAEKLAQAIIEGILPGSKMSFRLDQSSSVHDYDLRLSDGRICAVEVTASVDHVIEQTNVAVLDSKKGGSAIRRKLCQKDWLIHPASGARINLIRKKADEYLAAIESDGIERFFSRTDLRPNVERIYEELGVESGAVLPCKEPGYILIALPGGGGAMGPQRVFEAVRREAFKTDNRNKLGKAGTEERHLVVYVHPGNYLPWYSLLSFDPLGTYPELPNEITHVWAFTESRTAGNYVVWHADRASAWSRLDVILKPGVS